MCFLITLVKVAVFNCLFENNITNVVECHILVVSEFDTLMPAIIVCLSCRFV